MTVRPDPPPSPPASQRFRRHASAVSAELGSEVVALQLDTKRYFTLNETAMVIWRALAAPVTEPELVAAITAEFEVDEATARTETAALLQQLVDWQLAQPCD